MSDNNLEAIDRVVKIVRELDRYHGFVVHDGRTVGDGKPPSLAIGKEAREPLALVADQPETAMRRRQESASGPVMEPSAAQGRIALEAPLAGQLQKAMQDTERTSVPSGDGVALAASDEGFAPRIAGSAELAGNAPRIRTIAWKRRRKSLKTLKTRPNMARTPGMALSRRAPGRGRRLTRPPRRSSIALVYKIKQLKELN